MAPPRRASLPISPSCWATCAACCCEGARMTNTVEVKVPDIGGYDDVPVIEVLVAVGDTVAVDQGLLTLESDKATMEVPSSVAGVVRELKVKVGDKVSEGTVVAVLESADATAAAPAPSAPTTAAAPSSAPKAVASQQAITAASTTNGATPKAASS